MKKFDFSKTEGGRIYAELVKLTQEMIVVPNSCLPAEFWDNVRGGRTLARLNELTDKRDGITEHTKKQAVKARNIEKLSKQFEALATYKTHKGGTDFVDLSDEFVYSDNECDEIALHRAECALIGGMINGGLIDADDLQEDF